MKNNGDTMCCNVIMLIEYPAFMFRIVIYWFTFDYWNTRILWQNIDGNHGWSHQSVSLNMKVKINLIQLYTHCHWERCYLQWYSQSLNKYVAITYYTRLKHVKVYEYTSSYYNKIFDFIFEALFARIMRHRDCARTSYFLLFSRQNGGPS